MMLIYIHVLIVGFFFQKNSINYIRVLIYEHIRVALLHRDLDRNNPGDGLGPTIPLPTRKLHTTKPCLPSGNRVG